MPAESPLTSPAAHSETAENLPLAVKRLQEQIALAKEKENREQPAAADIVRSITDSVSLLSGLLKVVTLANELGKKGAEKTSDQANDVVVLAAKAINEKEHSLWSRDERLLLSLYSESHDREILLPNWFGLIQSTIDLETNTGSLPIPEQCARAIPDAGQELRDLVSACEELWEKYESLRQKNDTGSGDFGPPGKLTNAAFLAWGKKQDEIIDKLLTLEIDPVKLPPYTDQANFRLSPNAETIEKIAVYFTGLGNLIAELAKEGDAPLSSALSKAVPIFSSESGQLSEIKLIPLPALSAIPRKSFAPALPQIFETYASLRRLLVQIHEQFTSVNASVKMRAAKNAVGRCLGSVFVTNDVATLDALAKRKDDKSIQKSLRELLFSKAVSSVSADQSLFITDTKYAHFLPEAMNAILEGDKASIEKLRSSSGKFIPFVNFGQQLRKMLEPENRKDLAALFDEKLEHCTSTVKPLPVSYEERMAVLIGLAAVTNDPSSGSLLKTQLRKKALVSDLAEKITSQISQGQTSQGQFIGALSTLIAQRFSARLVDYWGQKRLKQEFRDAIAEHLTLLKNPEARKGFPPQSVFLNGHLIYGGTGAGKGYLLECVANEFGLPIETVTREQLEESALTKDGAFNQNNAALESAYAKFLSKRIEIAHDKMKKFGSVASFLFIDEMEAEFLNRNSATIDQAQINRTNVMLRVIEKKISENPEIIFVGATNHIDQVDKAARRTGRFGLPWKIDLPQEEDVKEILAGNFNRLGIDHAPAEGQKPYQDLVKQCIGLTPLTISQSVNNYICLCRAQESDSIHELKDELLQEIGKRIERLKARFNERDQELKRRASLSNRGLDV